MSGLHPPAVSGLTCTGLQTGGNPPKCRLAAWTPPPEQVA